MSVVGAACLPSSLLPLEARPILVLSQAECAKNVAPFDFYLEPQPETESKSISQDFFEFISEANPFQVKVFASLLTPKHPCLFIRMFVEEFCPGHKIFVQSFWKFALPIRHIFWRPEYGGHRPGVPVIDVDKDLGSRIL